MLSTYIYITNCLLHVSVFVTPSSGRPLRYLLKNVCSLQCCNIEKAYNFWESKAMVSLKMV